MPFANPFIAILLLAYLLTSLMTGAWLAPVPVLLIGLALLAIPLVLWFGFCALVFIVVLIIAPLLRVFKRSTLTENATSFESTSASEEANFQFESTSALFDPHLILQVSPGTSYEQIKTSYKKQLQQYHPDKVAHLGEALQDLANKRTRDIQRAYEALTLTRS